MYSVNIVSHNTSGRKRLDILLSVVLCSSEPEPHTDSIGSYNKVISVLCMRVALLK